MTYASTYPHKGYSISLAVLDAPRNGSQPSEMAADLMGPDLATGEKAGYRFTYIPGPFDLKEYYPVGPWQQSLAVGSGPYSCFRGKGGIAFALRKGADVLWNSKAFPANFA